MEKYIMQVEPWEYPPEDIDLSKYSGEDEVISSIELKKQLKERQSLFFHKTKFPTLNELIGGFTGGELTVVSGLTKNGKTLLCQTLTKDFADDGLLSLWFTYEVPALQFLNQFGEDLPHFYMPKLLKGRSTGWIFSRIKEAQLKFGIKAVFIDHLHFLADVMTKSNPSLEIGRVMRILKSWAVELNILIFIVCHTGKIQQGRELEAGDTRDSSFIEQESDNVFYIWRSKNRDNEAVLKITANRGRGVMDKKIVLMKRGNYLVELSKDLCYNTYNEREYYESQEDDFGED